MLGNLNRINAVEYISKAAMIDFLLLIMPDIRPLD